MKKPLSCVQIGVGGWGAYWCANVLPRLRELNLAEVAAVADINREALLGAKRMLGLDETALSQDAEGAIAKARPDFVIITVPPAHHEKIVDLALQYDCHILSEKPIADDMAACCRIYRKVKTAGKKMAVTMSHRFDQDKQSLEREIRSGQYGALSHLVGRNTWNCRKFASWGKFRHEIPDPLLIEGTVHHFDILRSLAGANARTVYALTWNPPWGEYAGDSNGLVTMEMENGVKAIYEGCKTSATTRNDWNHDYFRAECERGTLELDNRRLHVLSDLSGERVIIEKKLAEQPAWTNPWLAELFCEWLLGIRESHPTNLDDNIQCAALLYAAVESAHTRSVVDVPEFLKRNLERVA